MRQVIISNGYEIRDLIKTYGGTFRGSDKAWVISQEGFAKLVALSQKSGAGMGFIRGFAKAGFHSQI